ncbi:MAG: diguanylate cyclase [Prochloraceae cyanobacterium]
MSRPYSLELSAKRSIKYLDDLLNIKPLVLPKDMSIIKAVKESLARPPQLLEEPIIVEIGPQKYRLLDVHQLLVAQTRIHELASELLVKMYKKVERSSQVDGLTNLANRRLFDKSLLSKCNRAVKQKNSLSLIMCDVDFFQQYNELYGHLAGDDCLQKIANVIKKSLTRPKKDLAARYQGGEFAILLPNTDAVAAMSVASEIAKRVKNLAIRNHASPISSYVTLSFGIANIIPTREKDSELLLVGADRALSQAKRAGRNRQVVWKNSELKTAIKGLKVSKVENQSDKKVCIVLRDEDFSIASNYLRELGINTQLQLKNISIVSVSNIPENLSDFDVLVLDVASDRSPCISLIERIKFDGDLVIFAIESLPEAIRSNLSEKSTDFLIKPIPWKELKDKPYFS